MPISPALVRSDRPKSGIKKIYKSVYLIAGLRDEVHRLIYFFDPALWPVAPHERWRDRHPGRRTLVAGGLSVDPCRRVDGPLWHAAGDLVLRPDGDGLGGGLACAVGVGRVDHTPRHTTRRG